MYKRKDLAKKYGVSEVTIKNWFETEGELKEIQNVKQQGRKISYEYPENVIEVIDRVIYKGVKNENN